MKSIIFDLDMTLVDSSCAESARKARDWQNVYKLIPSFTLFDGLRDVFDVIMKFKIKTAIVSTAPRPYVERVCEHFKIPNIGLVCYHDCPMRKPAPDQMLKALDMLSVPKRQVVSFGDRVIDIQASNKAGIESIACLWGSREISELLSSDYCHALKYPKEIITLIR